MRKLIFALAAALAMDGPELRNPVPDSRPEASVDLMTAEGAALVKANWRYSDTRIVETDFTGPGLDGQPTGRPVRTYDYEPHAGGALYVELAHRGGQPEWSPILPRGVVAR